MAISLTLDAGADRQGCRIHVSRYTRMDQRRLGDGADMKETGFSHDFPEAGLPVHMKRVDIMLHGVNRHQQLHGHQLWVACAAAFFHDLYGYT